MNRGVLHFAPEHPVGAGHFPGNPIIPGALLLAEAVHLIETGLGMRPASCTIRSGKFFHPVRPGNTVEVAYAVSASQEIRFQCAVDSTKVLAGVMDATTGE